MGAGVVRKVKGEELCDVERPRMGRWLPVLISGFVAYSHATLD